MLASLRIVVRQLSKMINLVIWTSWRLSWMSWLAVQNIQLLKRNMMTLSSKFLLSKVSIHNSTQVPLLTVSWRRMPKWKKTLIFQMYRQVIASWMRSWKRLLLKDAVSSYQHQRLVRQWNRQRLLRHQQPHQRRQLWLQRLVILVALEMQKLVLDCQVQELTSSATLAVCLTIKQPSMMWIILLGLSIQVSWKQSSRCLASAATS